MHAQHLAGIGKPQRAGDAGEPGCGDAGDLRRGVGAQPHHAVADRVHQAEGLIGHRGAGTGEQAVLEFQQRRLHPLIPMAREGLGQDLDEHRLALRLGRQHVGKASGQQGGVGRVVGHRPGWDQGEEIQAARVWQGGRPAATPAPRPACRWGPFSRG
jgi:hypothetical protein